MYKLYKKFIIYFNRNEKATKECVDSRGFLHSGDVGAIDKRGNLSITGRIKELIITGGGENIAPVLVENEVNYMYIKVKKYLGDIIANCILIGD